MSSVLEMNTYEQMSSPPSKKGEHVDTVGEELVPGLFLQRSAAVHLTAKCQDGLLGNDTSRLTTPFVFCNSRTESGLLAQVFHD